MSVIEEVATLTSKGRITLPKPVRQALGVGAGGKVSLRSAGGKNDPYAVFQKMLAKGTPPDAFGALVKSAGKSMP